MQQQLERRGDGDEGRVRGREPAEEAHGGRVGRVAADVHFHLLVFKGKESVLVVVDGVEPWGLSMAGRMDRPTYKTQHPEARTPLTFCM